MLQRSLGVINVACVNADIARSTFYEWLDKDPIFAQQVKEIEDIQVDFVEGKLFEQIDKGNVASTIFYLKTKGKHRGYVEEVQHTMTAPPFEHLTIEVVKPHEDQGK